MKLAKTIIYATGNSGLEHQFDIGDNNLVYGLAVAWTFVDALKHAGANPTRTSLMKALRNLNESGANKNPFVYPGMIVKTSSTRTFPMEQLILREVERHDPRLEDVRRRAQQRSLGRSLLLSFEGELRLPLVVSSRARPDP